MSKSGTPPMCSCGCGRPGDFGRGMCQASYERHRRREIAYGRWEPHVPAEAARTHIERLRAAGLRPRQLAHLAGVNPVTVRNIARPDWERIRAGVERAILAVPVPERPGDVVADNARVPIVGAQRRIQALVAHGYPQAHIARELEINPASSTMSALIGRPNTAAGSTGQTIAAGRDRAVKALFDRLQMVPGPSERARAYGRERGWPLPFEWDEDSIDDPAARPVRARWTRRSASAELKEQVRDMAVRGVPTAQIAGRLGVTVRTVERTRQLTVVGALDRPELDWGLDR